MTAHKKIPSQNGYYHATAIIQHKDANVMLNLDQTYYASETIHIMLSHHKDPIPHSQYNSWNDIKARGWNVDPLIILTAGARGSTHKNTISELKQAFSLPKNIIEPMVSQLNIIAIKYAMNILLFKRKLENNQPLPLTIN
jgi:hypothetical protein